MGPKKRKNDSDSEDVVGAIKKKKDGQNGSHSCDEDAIADNENQPVFCTPQVETIADHGHESDHCDDDVCIVNEGTNFPPGEVLVCGGMNWDLTGRKTIPKGAKNLGGRTLWEAHRIGSLKGVKVKNIISGCNACHSVIITADGRAHSFGRNDRGQLGLGDVGQRKDVPTLIEDLESVRIVDGSCGKNHTLLLSDTGRVFAFGDNKMGQLGLGNQNATVPSPKEIDIDDIGPVTKVACGGEFSMILTDKGTLYSFGCPEYGQLGHNTDGKYFVTSSKLSFHCELKPRPVKLFFDVVDGRYANVRDVQITNMAAGTNHSVAIDQKKRVYTWGFGGYGRLGHNEQKDELVPRMIRSFDGHPGRAAAFCEAGSTFTLIVTNPGGVIYMCGINKPNGDAMMYPKHVQDLTGWNVRSVGCCYKSIVVAAEESTISWGSAPTYGELGYGEGNVKSSVRPKVMKPLDGIYVQKVACGYGHSMMIARADSEEDKARIEKLSVFSA